MNIFEKYIEKCLREYQEPTRQGTPRGEKIGLSSEKYLAALMVGLLRHKLKDIAEENIEIYGEKIKFSYGLLRKWKTEKDFKRTTREAVTDFAAFFVRELESLVNKNIREINLNFDKKPVEEVSNVDYGQLFVVASMLNPDAILAISKLARRRFPDVENNGLHWAAMMILRRFLYYAGMLDRDPFFEISEFDFIEGYLKAIEEGDLPKEKVQETCRMIRILLNSIKETYG